MVVHVTIYYTHLFLTSEIYTFKTWIGTTILKTQIQIKYKSKRYLFIILLPWWGISMQGIWLKMVVFLHPYDKIVYWNTFIWSLNNLKNYIAAKEVHEIFMCQNLLFP
jgi:hypothetical protein